MWQGASVVERCRIACQQEVDPGIQQIPRVATSQQKAERRKVVAADRQRRRSEPCCCVKARFEAARPRAEWPRRIGGPLGDSQAWIGKGYWRVDGPAIRQLDDERTVVNNVDHPDEGAHIRRKLA